jgi:hypothetical protein
VDDADYQVPFRHRHDQQSELQARAFRTAAIDPSRLNLRGRAASSWKGLLWPQCGCELCCKWSGPRASGLGAGAA